MQNDTILLLSSRFYAYAKGGRPWGLPNHLWCDAPQMVILFDQLLCDERAFHAEELAAKQLGWVMSELFVKLKAEGILTTADTEGIVRKAKEPPARLRIPQVDSYYAVHVQQQLGIPLFDWEGKLAKTAGTLAPSTTRPNRQPPKAALKLTYLWSIIARPTQVVPPLDSLPGEAGAAYRKVLKMQTPSWQQLERCEIDIDEYTLALTQTQFTDLYEKIDGPIRSSARRKFDQLAIPRQNQP